MPDKGQFDILIIGSGEAGKYLAWTMAKAGRRTAVVERGLIGGACPNIACLPSKNVIHSAKVPAQSDLLKAVQRYRPGLLERFSLDAVDLSFDRLDFLPSRDWNAILIVWAVSLARTKCSCDGQPVLSQLYPPARHGVSSRFLLAEVAGQFRLVPAGFFRYPCQ